MGIVSLILGLFSVVAPFILEEYGWIGIIAGIVGIILGAVGRKNPEKKGIATAGMIVSIVSTALSLIFWLACFICVASVASEIGVL